MKLVEIEILGMAITHDHGTLGQGDVLRTSPEFARHLVDDCKVAKYSKAKAPEPEPETPDAAVEPATETPEDEPAQAQKPAKKR
ncbi:hypothetical protein F2P45_31740 [Massilia sp. CCM 8733]|uniref:Uncharacterized protein n=1 Tax=Massilia mucilaginosa TaxID=2609282 RepID=A0ABX0P460_9BURK|nr:hypothetical protein [Massilia mucilaginosa]NHZ93540.1 hypothetical protein [Massilia mucilaginosa]